MVTVIAKLIVKEEKRVEAFAAIREFVSAVAREEGTMLFTVSQNRKEPGAFIFMERYHDRMALDAHSRTPHFKAFNAKGAEFLAGKPEIAIMEELFSAH